MDKIAIQELCRTTKKIAMVKKMMELKGKTK